MLRLPLLAALGLLAALWLPRPAEAAPRPGGVVGDGHNSISCQQSALVSKLAGGGLVTFACGPDPVDITLTSRKTITLPTIIDGGGLITLHGQNPAGFFWVNADASLELEDMTLRQGHAFTGGALINLGWLTIENSSLVDNVSDSDAGAIYSTGTLVVRGSTFTGNQAGAFAAAILNWGSADISGSSFSGNNAVDDGGAIENEGALRLQNTSFSNNRGRYGGAVFSEGPLTITASSFVSNTGLTIGGGVFNFGPGVISSSTFLSNTSPSGAAIFNDAFGNLTVGNSTIMNNFGVGISNTHVLTLTGSTLASNAGHGLTNTGLATLANDTFSNNQGAGVDATSSATVLNTTFAGNAGGGIVNRSLAILVMKNTLLAGNGAHNCVGPITSLGHNLDDGHACGLNAAGDKSATNPLLLPLANNGGPTLTRALLPGSPAIGAGDNFGCPAADQRGVPRLGGCDIGAFESVYRRFLALLIR